MTTISGIVDTATLNSTTSTTSTSTTSTDSTTADQDKFMKLLVTQLQNQDPLNPMDNAEMTSQLAQLSTVTGINKLNTTLTSLQTDLSTNTQTTTAISMIGKGILVDGKGIELSSSTATDGTTTNSSVFGIDLASAAENVTITIADSTGKTVRTMSMSNVDAGTYPISWDGTTDSNTTAAAGSYTFSVTATSGGSTLTDATPLQLAAVASVSTGTSGVKLNTSLGQFAMSDVKEVL
ncbi:flagellar hook assembly protein FlgD [Duganella sp. FT80W]|uniref:Basal-body rod modification protein FlgD n=1 Tax=Duganella guangzhouensis TaxID=2666084 RepID=A0A6I2L748_9BURK|nr:flagellar hook capping FlgD N-terminal domain-containing protein [Duganella guangzhouensis]MRW92109.1 flagellar hook assembly protein FlgD [Duganella guangzhouensis]